MLVLEVGVSTEQRAKWCQVGEHRYFFSIVVLALEGCVYIL
jgi:hypothetical protein